MKTTFDLPDPLLRRAKAAAAHEGRPLREFVVEAIENRLAAPPKAKAYDAQAEWARFLKGLDDDANGSNPRPAADDRFFAILEQIRAESGRAGARDAFGGSKQGDATRKKR